jgi:hypothetical protein
MSIGCNTVGPYPILSLKFILFLLRMNTDNAVYKLSLLSFSLVWDDISLDQLFVWSLCLHFCMYLINTKIYSLRDGMILHFLYSHVWGNAMLKEKVKFSLCRP